MENKEFLFITKFFEVMGHFSGTCDGTGPGSRADTRENGVHLPGARPASIPSCGPGIHTFKGSPPGFGTMRRIPRSAILGAAILVAILVSAGCTKEAPQTGSLQVTSTPAGLEVQVILDGNFKGMTPLLLSNLSAGSHLVQLRSPGYAERVQLVTVNAGQKMTIAADYPPIPASAPVTPIPLPTAEPTTLPTVKITEVPETPLPQGPSTSPRFHRERPFTSTGGGMEPLRG